MNHTTVRPARLKFHSWILSTDVLRVFGYQARCACGWEGPIRSHHGVARRDARTHICEERET
jgi:hypothetical protein